MRKKKGYVTVRVWQRKLKGRNAYYLRWTDMNGRRHAEACQARTKADANVFAKKKERELNDGAYVDLKPITFDEFRQEHVRLLEGMVSAKALGDHDRVLRRFEAMCQPVWLSDVTPKMVERFLNSRRTQKDEEGIHLFSDNTVNKDVRILKSAFNCAIRRGYLHGNPCRDIKPKRTPKKDLRILEDDEIVSLLNACPSQHWCAFMLVQAQGGLRLGEAQYLEWSDIDWQNHVIRVVNKPDHPLKDREPREAPLFQDTERALLALHADARNGSRYILENARGGVWLYNLRRDFKKGH